LDTTPTVNVDMETMPPFGIQEETPNGGINWYPPPIDDNFKPLVGKSFKSLDDAFNFYKNYARKAGFSVKRGSSWVSKKKNANNEPSLKYFNCVKQGRKYKKKPAAFSMMPSATEDTSLSSSSNVTEMKKTRRQRPSVRTGCSAMVRVKKNKDNLYVVSEFVEVHNHYLVNSADAIFLRGNRQLKYTQQQFLVQVSTINYGPVRGFKLMKEIFGGFEKVGATKDDCRNFRRNLNLFIGERDAQMCVDKLMFKKEFCPGYSAEYFTQEDQSLGGLFWADEDAKRYYLNFGDVVSFDATYRSNR
jgi:zinc finger SWIM domain-containing protein 3